MKMMTKLEANVDRVKGLSFHSRRPWIVASLHSGEIQLWDYQTGSLIRKFDEHDGAVGGVDFHKSEPLLVSGGDDKQIKVWNCETHESKSLVTLVGHQGKISTVQFHHECPWILSASDDETIRIWNWDPEACILVLTAHNDHVKSASFHPRKDLVLSASMDGTVRIWDIGALRKKTLSPGGFSEMKNVGGVNLDVECVFKGDHDSGVNWASFHPSLPLFASGSNDRLVKSWLWEGNLKVEEILRGHMDNVSSVVFHPKRNDIVVSSSEDKSIRVWDVPNETEILSFCREHDRFWTLAVHPVINLLAAGHDSGMIVFKLARERPAFVVSGDLLFYAKDMCLRCYHFSTGQDSKVIPLFGPDTGAASLNQSPRTLSYSPRDEAALIFYGGSYELFLIPSSGFVQEPRRGTGDSSVFIAKSRFALLERSSNQVIVMDLQNKVVKTRSLPMPTNAIFYAGTAVLLCTNEDKACMYDLVRDAVLGELQFPGVRSIVWSTDMESVALLSKHSICIASKMLVSQCVIDEKIPVKSAAWGDHDVLIYTTLRHIKYCLPNGDSATIRPLDFPMYITKVSGNTLFCLDRDGNVIIASRDVEIQQDADAGYELVSGWLFGGMDVEGIFADGVPWYLNYDDHDNAEAVGWGVNRLRRPRGDAHARMIMAILHEDHARYNPFRRRR